MTRPAHEVFNDYISAQCEGDIEKIMRHISTDAVFDVGRGHFEGEEVRAFHERLLGIHSTTGVIEIQEDAQSPDRMTARLEQRDDDLKPLGIDSIELDAEVLTNEAGLISLFRARPTPASLAIIMAARDAGRNSEGVKLAEQAGNLSSSADDE